MACKCGKVLAVSANVYYIYNFLAAGNYEEGVIDATGQFVTV